MSQLPMGTVTLLAREHHGYEVDTQGDGFFVVFVRAREAIQATVAAQRALTTHSWPEGVVVRVRMGLHTGEPSLVHQRSMLKGPHMNTSYFLLLPRLCRHFQEKPCSAAEVP